MPLHLCFLCNEYPPEPHGGVGALAQTLGRALVARGHRVTVVGVSSGRVGEEEDEGVRVLRMAHTRVRGAGFWRNGHTLRTALAAVDHEDPIDVLEGQELSLAVLPARTRYPTVIRMHGGHHFFATTLGRRPRAWRSWLERRSFGRADHLCAVSRYVGETTRALLGLGDRPITVVPNAVDPESFRPMGPAATPPEITFAGTICEKKGVGELVAALPSILAGHGDVRLVVAGRDWVDEHGSFRSRIEAGLDTATAEHVRFLGAVDHDAMPALLAAATVCVFPSHMEAMPLTWLEAMAAGRAVVAGAIGPAPEIIEDGRSGLLCDPRDPAAIAAAVSRLLDDAALRERLGAAARERVVRHFSVSSVVEANEAFFRHCAEAGPLS